MEGGAVPVPITMRRIEGGDVFLCRSSVVFALRIGDHQIEATYSERDDVTIARWIRDVQRVHRERLRGGLCAGRNLVVGLCTFRPKPWMCSRKELKALKGDYPLSAVSLCAGGSHCLVVPVDDGEAGCRFFRPFPQPLVAFLADQRTTFVGIGIKNAAERLERFWGVHVSNATELRPLVAAAFGREAVPPYKGGGGDADGLRKMASVALKGLNAGKKPAAVEFFKGYLFDSRENVKYAFVDAFLTCQVAEACFHAINTRGSYDSEGVF